MGVFEALDPKCFCHLGIVLVTDTIWNRVAPTHFPEGQGFSSGCPGCFRHEPVGAGAFARPVQEFVVNAESRVVHEVRLEFRGY